MVCEPSSAPARNHGRKVAAGHTGKGRDGLRHDNAVLSGCLWQEGVNARDAQGTPPCWRCMGTGYLTCMACRYVKEVLPCVNGCVPGNVLYIPRKHIPFDTYADVHLGWADRIQLCMYETGNKKLSKFNVKLKVQLRLIVPFFKISSSKIMCTVAL